MYFSFNQLGWENGLAAEEFEKSFSTILQPRPIGAPVKTISLHLLLPCDSTSVFEL